MFHLYPFRLAMLWVSLILPVSVFAMSDGDSDDAPFQTAHVVSEKAQVRAYVGGRDEQNLEIQPILAQPGRNVDGSAAVVSDDDDEPRVTAPETD